METCCERENTKRKPRDTFLMTNRRRWRRGRGGGEGRGKCQAPHVPHVYAVFPLFCLFVAYVYPHFRRPTPLSLPSAHDFDSAASKSTQVNALRCDVARLESSRVILHLKCRQRVLCVVLLPRPLTDQQPTHIYRERERKRERGRKAGDWPNWLRDRRVLN